MDVKKGRTSVQYDLQEKYVGARQRVTWINLAGRRTDRSSCSSGSNCGISHTRTFAQIAIVAWIRGNEDMLLAEDFWELCGKKKKMGGVSVAEGGQIAPPSICVSHPDACMLTAAGFGTNRQTPCTFTARHRWQVGHSSVMCSCAWDRNWGFNAGARLTSKSSGSAE